MFKLIIRFLLVVSFGFVLQACGDKVKPEQSCNFVQNSQKQRVSWVGGPVKVFIHSSVPKFYWDSLQAAVDHLNNEAATDLLKIVAFDVAGNINPSRDGVNLVTWHTKWTGGSAQEQARTTIHWSKNRIYESDIKINAENFIYDDGPGPQFVDLTSLMIHEFGHMLGLAHNDDHDSIMRPKLGFGVIRGYTLDDEGNQETDIRAVDVNSLACEYNMAK